MSSAQKNLIEGIRVAIIGSGPAGLAAAIELAKLPFVDWQLYEQKSSISEISTGITIQRTTWRLLEKMGASRHLKTGDFFRPADGHDTQYRNGRVGNIVKQTYPDKSVPTHQAPARIHRAKLQQALLKEADQTRIRLGKKLITATRLPCGRIDLEFGDGTKDRVDLLVGADGIRSAVRSFAFPNYSVKYSGMTAYRAVVRAKEAGEINGLEKAFIFWYGTDAKWVYTCPLDDKDWEVTCRVREPDDGNRSTWGQDVDVAKLIDSLGEYCQPVQQILTLVDKVKRYDYFGGPRLETVVKHGAVALTGDASHPLSGAFGAGAAFAMEDSYVLAGALRWAADSSRGLSDALKLFDDVRSPHYLSLYRTLDEIAAAHHATFATATSADETIVSQIDNVSLEKHNWMYYHDADLALADAISGLRPAGARVEKL